MAYELSIEREGGIPIAEWLDVLGATDGVREDASAVSMTNPKTGEVITVNGRSGDAAVQIDGDWVPTLNFFACREEVETVSTRHVSAPLAPARAALSPSVAVIPRWVKAFHWRGDRAVFRFRESMRVRTDSVRCAAIRLAGQLEAVIVGEEGETFGW